MPDKPYLLEPRKVAAAVRKAHAEKRLGYQRGHTICRYDYGDGCGCAIGVALPKGLLTPNDNFASLREIDAKGYVTTRDEDSFILLQNLQSAHDNLCIIGTTPERGAAFLRAISACEAA